MLSRKSDEEQSADKEFKADRFEPSDVASITLPVREYAPRTPTTANEDAYAETGASVRESADVVYSGRSGDGAGER